MAAPSVDMDEIAKGNRKAFETLFKEHFKSLCIYAAYRTRDAEAAREIVQDLFCHLWEKRTELQIHTSLQAYLYRSAHNAALNYLKHENVKERSHKFILDHSSQESYEVEEEVKARDLATALTSAIESLPGKTREIFELVRFREMKYREVADYLNISQKTVEAHMSAALKLLRTSLRSYLPEILFFVFIMDRVFSCWIV
ncbi:MAG: RNA polymerase sigma-70 factor [Bacteroidales bacterium]